MSQKKGRAAVAAYRVAIGLTRPLVSPVLAYRRYLGKEDPARIAERRGIASQERPAGRLVWVHAASVGETLTVLPMIGRLIGGGEHVLLTGGTVTSAVIAGQAVERARRDPPVRGEERRGSLTHQYVPLDMPAFIQRFLDYWRPDIALFAESELWPVTIDALAARRIPLVLVNARMSDRSYRRWQRFSGAAHALLNRIDLCLAQSGEDARRFRELGARRVENTGNLKLDAPAPDCDRSQLEDFAAAIAGRPVFLAASTHAGEDEHVLAVHDALVAGPNGGLAGLLTIIAPRHPERGPDIARLAESCGLVSSSRSRGEPLGDRTAVYIADTIGEMGLWYRLASVAFVGGSLVQHGGQNPVEAAKLGTPVIHGPHVTNFRAIYGTLDASGAALRVADPHAMRQAVQQLLLEPDVGRQSADRARAWVEESAGALDRTLAALRPLRGGQPRHGHMAGG